MTIRQKGGIFGRNPTFNNVTVDGTLTVDQIVEKTGAAGITLDGVTLKDGNVVLANGNGIDFSATSGTGTSELFDDYEEGTWTVTVSDNSGNNSPTTVTGYYTKVGDIVHCSFESLNNIDTTGLTAGDLLTISLPFSSASTGGASCGSVVTDTITLARANPFSFVSSGSAVAIIRTCATAVSDSAVLVSDITSGTSDIVRFQITYKV